VSPEDGTRGRQRLSTTPLTSLTGLSSTAASCWWATLASVPAAPLLLWRTPSRHPIGKACVAIVGRAGSTDRSASSTLLLAGAALSMHPAAPFFLAHRPSHHPIGEAVSTIVWVGRRSYRHRHWCWHWHWWHWRGNWLRASNVVDPAAPRPLVRLPHARCVHCTIEGVDWTDRPRRRCRARRCRARWQRARRRLWWGWWGCWRGSRWRSGLRNDWCLGGATDSASLAAVLLLCWRPHRYCCRGHCTN